MPPEGSPPASGYKSPHDALNRVRAIAASVPLPARIVLAVVLGVLLSPVVVACGLVYAPYAVWSGRRSVAATAAVALWGVALLAGFLHGPGYPRYALLLLVGLCAIAAHAGTLGRWHVP
jgi:hypothetical protein